MPRNEYGDFQTPLPLARKVVALFSGTNWTRVLEPTCGLGNFLEAADDLGPIEKIGIEVQHKYVVAASEHGNVTEESIFSLDLGRDIKWQTDGRLLVIGNPPWVTSADLSVLESRNLPEKINLKRLRGLEARTGSANFDIAEYIILKIIRELGKHEPVVALLCKAQVARNVIDYCSSNKFPVASSRFYPIDSVKWFGANVDAGLMVIELKNGKASYVCHVYDSLDAIESVRTWGVVNNQLVSDVASYEFSRYADGASPYEWRQGIKHDASSIMELVEDDGPKTKAGEPVDIEPDYLYPLLKCTDVRRGRTSSCTKWMVVPQRSLKDSTAALERSAPRLWSYLDANGSALDGRKSSIYRNRARFCIFGVGDYTFSPYKVAISGLHKEPEFRLIAELRDKSVVFDDTCYFLSFDFLNEAAVVAATLRSRDARLLIESLVFWDSKRPITKKLLQRVDICALANRIDSAWLEVTARELADIAGESLTRESFAQALESVRRQPQTLFDTSALAQT